jgi:hypothetical protein
MTRTFSRPKTRSTRHSEPGDQPAAQKGRTPVVINVVRVNDRFWEDEAAWLAEQRENPGPQQKPAPETFPTETYFEADLTGAIDDIARVTTSMRQIESASFLKHP